MLSKDENVVGETKFFYKIQDENGDIKYKCKKCGEIVDSKLLAKHECVREEISKDRETKKKDVLDDILSDDIDEITREMAEELYNQLSITPGCRGRDKIQWIVRWFVKSQQARNNPTTLYNVLSRTFPHATDDALNFIVDSVFEIKRNYQNRRGYQGVFSQDNQISFQQAPLIQQQPIPYDPLTMLNNILELVDKLRPQQQVSEEVIRAKIENEMLREEIKTLREQVNNLIRNMPRAQQTPDSWNDDWAKLTYLTIHETKEVLQTIIQENKRFRQTLIKLLAYGDGRREVEETSEEILDELEKAGLVEGEVKQ